jgi:hypothetical protein
MDNALWALVGTLAGAVFALAGVGLQTFFTYRAAVANVHASTRSVNRKKWMNRVLARVRDLVTLCIHYPGTATRADDDKKATRLAAELLLLLNPEDQFAKPEQVSAECTELQRELTEILTRGLADMLAVPREGAPDAEQVKRSRETANAFATRLIERIRKILAHEWQLVIQQQ